MQSNEYGVGRDVQSILVSPGASVQHYSNYDVHKSVPVQDVLKAMLGPRCDENGDVYDKITHKMQQLHDIDCRKPEMKIEIWTFRENGKIFVSATSIFRCLYMGSRDHIARTQRRLFEICRIPHLLIEVPGVSSLS
jgi:hypothetical protein